MTSIAEENHINAAFDNDEIPTVNEDASSLPAFQANSGSARRDSNRIATVSPIPAPISSAGGPHTRPSGTTQHSMLALPYEPSVITVASTIADDIENQLQKKVEHSPQLNRIKKRISNMAESAKLPTIDGTEIQIKYLILDFSSVSY